MLPVRQTSWTFRTPLSSVADLTAAVPSSAAGPLAAPRFATADLTAARSSVVGPLAGLWFAGVALTAGPSFAAGLLVGPWFAAAHGDESCSHLKGVRQEKAPPSEPLRGAGEP